MAFEEPGIVSISSQSGMRPEEIARHSFPQARRGLDGEAVQRYLEAVAAEMSALFEREQALRKRLADAERRAADPVLDEETLLRAVGTETVRILQQAHQAATDVITKAEARFREVEAEAEERTRAEAVELMEATRAECREMIREARELRAEILRDLAGRRRSLKIQLEELRTGRDSLADVVDAVAVAAEELRERLANAEEEARAAAVEAGDRVAADQDDSDLLGETAGGAAGDGAGELAEVIALDEAEAGQDGGEEGEGSDQSSRASVDVLFARIRASRDSRREEEAEAELSEPFEIEAEAEEEAEDEEEVEAYGEPAEHAAGAGSPGEQDDAEGSGPAEASATPGIAGGEELERESEPEAGAELPEPPEEQKEAEDPAAARRALAERTELLSPVTIRLSRALKRALQDDQNLLLDAMRNSAGAPDIEKLLPEETQRARIEESTAVLLSEAFEAGYRWLGRGREPVAGEVEAAGESLAAALASEVTAFLRTRLHEALSSMQEAADEAADAAGAAYREWRGRRVEAAAGDYATRAFASGSVTAAAGTRVRWVVDDEGEPCPDCDDNALAGFLIAGEEFPTGQVHPPIHPGCRCLLVAASS